MNFNNFVTALFTGFVAGVCAYQYHAALTNVLKQVQKLENQVQELEEQVEELETQVQVAETAERNALVQVRLLTVTLEAQLATTRNQVLDLDC
jgi:peptidoglycan hydrolase CwlO-like protein